MISPHVRSVFESWSQLDEDFREFRDERRTRHWKDSVGEKPTHEQLVVEAIGHAIALRDLLYAQGTNVGLEAANRALNLVEVLNAARAAGGPDVVG